MDRRLAPFALSAFLWLLAWVGLSATTVLYWGRPLASPALAWTHFAMLGIGLAGCLVVGVGHRLWKNFYGARMPPTPLLITEVILLDLAALLHLAAVFPEGGVPRPPAILPGLVLAAAVAAWITALALQWRSLGHPPRDQAAGDRASRWLLAAPPLYAFLAAALAVRTGSPSPAVVHLWLLGVVANTIFLVSHRFLPRFSTMASWPRVHEAQAALAVTGPGLVALALQGTGGGLAWLGGLVELGAIVLYAVLVTAAAFRPRSPHPVLAFHFLAGAALLWGAILGIESVLDPALRVHSGVHAVNNLVGFVVLTIWGMGSVLLGIAIRAVDKGVNRDVWIHGLTVAALLVFWEWTAWSGRSAETVASLLLLAALALQAFFGLRNALWLRRMGR